MGKGRDWSFLMIVLAGICIYFILTGGVHE